MLSMDMIYDAQKILKGAIEVTPLVAASKIGENVYTKCENLQKTGSFKLRGAYYKISKLTDDEKKNGVIACSAGNHAQGVALAASKTNIKSVICIPKGAPLSKVEATKGYGAEVVLVEGVYDDAYNEAKKIEKERNMTFVHPFDDYEVMAGQGTIGLEILQQFDDVDVVVVPIGGGGLISGIAYCVKQLKPNCKVIGVQAEGAPSMYNAIKKDEIETLGGVLTVADGIAVKRSGNLTFEICKKYVDEIITVTEKEIALSMLTLVERHKTICEGAGAVAAAAVLSKKIDCKKYNKVVCVISGGNVDMSTLTDVLNKALVYSGRLTEISTILQNKPGNLIKLLKILADTEVNVVNVVNRAYDESTNIGCCAVNILVETKDIEHQKEIIDLLKQKGYSCY
ncbi:MAG: threonine ammonia-lyase [Oscillospiraceae bacterium]